MTQACKQCDSLRFELTGLERTRLRDNAYLIGKRDQLRQRVRDVVNGPGTPESKLSIIKLIVEEPS